MTLDSMKMLKMRKKKNIKKLFKWWRIGRSTHELK